MPMGVHTGADKGVSLKLLIIYHNSVSRGCRTLLALTKYKYMYLHFFCNIKLPG